MLELEDLTLLERFRACALAAADFTHEHHVRLARAYLLLDPLPLALLRFSTDLKRFAGHHGAPGKYHETITFAFLVLINARLQNERSFAAFAEKNPDLFDRGILLRYYTSETLSSAFARHTFVLPEKLSP